VDGRQPDWGGYFDRIVEKILEGGEPLNPTDRSLLEFRGYHIALDPDKRKQADRIAALLAATGSASPRRFD